VKPTPPPPPPPPPVPEGIIKGLKFSFNSFMVDAEAQREIDKIAEALKANPQAKINIIGHTDAVGSETDNMKLSTNRAESVRQALINLGIAGERMTTLGKGESELLNSVDPKAAENRRVEIKVIK